jgi:hypothetical protein
MFSSKSDLRFCGEVISSFFWDVTQRRSVISYRRFNTIYRDRNVGYYDKSTLHNVPEEQRYRVHFLPHITDTASLLPTVYGRHRSRILLAVYFTGWFILSIKNVTTQEVGKVRVLQKLWGWGMGRPP